MPSATLTITVVKDKGGVHMGRTSSAEPDKRAYVEELYIHYLPIMEKTALKFLVDKSEVEDVINDCAEKLVRLIGAGPILRDGAEGNMAAFLAFMVRNRSYDYNRRLLRERKYISQVSLEELALIDEGSMPEERVLSREWFSDALFGLSVTDQRLIIGKYLFDETDEELARQFGCKPNSIRVKLMRARDRMKKLAEGGERKE